MSIILHTSFFTTQKFHSYKGVSESTGGCQSLSKGHANLPAQRQPLPTPAGVSSERECPSGGEGKAGTDREEDEATSDVTQKSQGMKVKGFVFLLLLRMFL